MKIAISAQDTNLDSLLDERFGRAKFFIIYDDETKEFASIDNHQNLNAMQGAGIKAGKTIIDSDAKVLITGNVGPKAFQVLDSANIEIYSINSVVIKDAIIKYQNKELNKVTGATVEGHW